MESTQVDNKCQENSCANKPIMTYLGKRICQKHWELTCNKIKKETKHA